MAIRNRYLLQSAARELLKREKVATCGRHMIPNGTTTIRVNITQVDKRRRSASFGGLLQCGSTWLCPVCSNKISERRREELSRAVERWHNQHPDHRVLLVTFTLQHHAGESLAAIMAGLKQARAALVSGRWAADFRAAYQIVGMVRGLEITYGANGWHPHLHCLYFLRKSPDIIGFEQELSERWRQALASNGRYATWSHGVHVKFSDSELASYIAKYGKEPKQWGVSHETTKGPAKISQKGGATPFQLLYEYATMPAGPERLRYGRLFLTYAAHMKGQRALFWSKGLRQLLALEEELTDEELVKAPELGTSTMAVLGGQAWHHILCHDARADVLLAAGKGKAALARLLQKLGIDPNWYYFPDELPDRADLSADIERYGNPAVA